MREKGGKKTQTSYINGSNWYLLARFKYFTMKQIYIIYKQYKIDSEIPYALSGYND